MATTKTKTKATPLLSLLFTFTIQSLTIPSISSSTDSFVFSGCTQQKYEPASPYESSLNSLLTSLVNSATHSSYNNFTIMGSSSPEDVVYGLYQCRGDLSMTDCSTCVSRAVSQVGALCPQTCGGALQLQGCYVKYDNATFLGVQDETVVLKKCGPPVGYDPDAIGRRDSALQGLMTGGGGPYRVGGAGKVQGLAQCVGDLSVGECGDCLAQAIGQLKSDCGTADYGDMFLGKCYARYSTDKAQAQAQAQAQASSSYYEAHGDGEKCSSDGEKTFAIFIGLLALVALIVIFLTFISKVFGEQGKQ